MLSSLQCLATLIPNVPYQRLKPGLLNRVSKQIKPFLHHRDPNIRVACLTCLGSIVTVQCPLLEVCYILQPSRPASRLSDSSASSAQDPAHKAQTSESGYHSSSTGNASGTSSSGGDQNPGPVDNLSPAGIPTPSLSSGSQTPTMSSSEQFYSLGGGGGETGTPWVVRLCVMVLVTGVVR